MYAGVCSWQSSSSAHGLMSGELHRNILSKPSPVLTALQYSVEYESWENAANQICRVGLSQCAVLAEP